jgi:hypothetical protein
MHCPYFEITFLDITINKKLKNHVRICALLKNNSILFIPDRAKQTQFWTRLKIIICEERI